MRQVNQRVALHCELEPLSREEVTGYVTHRLKVAGGGADRIAFSQAALDVVYAESGGVPRLINLLCARALHHAWVERTATVEPDKVWKAVENLGLSHPPASPAAEGARAEPGPLDAFAAEPVGEPAAQPVEEHEERRPEDRAVRQQGQRGEECPTRRVSPLVAALAVAAALAAGAALALGSQRAIRLFVADLLSTVDVPSPGPSPMAPILQAPLPPDPATSGEVRPAAAEPYAIQVASFDNPLLANRLVKVLTGQGYRAYPVEVNLGERGRVQRVFVGRYRTLDQTASELARIREMPGHGDARILDVQQSHIALEPR